VWVKCLKRPLWSGAAGRGRGEVPRANVNRVQRREEGDKKKWFRTIIGVYTRRRSQKAVDSAQTVMWMCIHWKPRRKHTQKLNELCQHDSHVTSYCHTSLTSLYSLIWLEYLHLFRNGKQVWWMKCRHVFPPSVPKQNSVQHTALNDMYKNDKSWSHALQWLKTAYWPCPSFFGCLAVSIFALKRAF
jgi:hypothetical protein